MISGLAMGCGLAVCGAIVGASALAMARKIVSPGGGTDLAEVHDITDSTVTLTASPKTMSPGSYGLWLQNRGQHFKVGDVLHHDSSRRLVTRSCEPSPRQPVSFPMKGEWTGHVFSCPAEVSSAYSEVSVSTALGPAPAWHFPGTSRPDTWVIHIHGQNTTRLTALRSVPSAARAGMTSLVPSFRNDGEGPGRASVSSFGATEWRDIDAAMEHALEEGAQRVVLVGWSMGAQMALAAAHRSKNAHAVVSLVLVAPVTDVEGVIRARARRARIPGLISSAALAVLKTPGLCRVVGLPSALPLGNMDWSQPGGLSVPTLVVHSSRDPKVPSALSEQFAAAHSSFVDLELVDTEGHAWEYNHDPDGFTKRLSSFLMNLSEDSTVGLK